MFQEQKKKIGEQIFEVIKADCLEQGGTMSRKYFKSKYPYSLRQVFYIRDGKFDVEQAAKYFPIKISLE
jgi:hypothetical protein